MAKKNNTALKVGAGIAAAGALAYGAYKLYGKDGAKNRKKLEIWMKEMGIDKQEAKALMMDLQNKGMQMVTSKMSGMKGKVAKKGVRMAKSAAKKKTTKKK